MFELFHRQRPAENRHFPRHAAPAGLAISDAAAALAFARQKCLGDGQTDDAGLGASLAENGARAAAV